jgi:hypothetical protein
MNYNIKAIPTRYSGITFRSRLEARWAAFFDLMCWTWHYEPFDLDGWFPDFLIEGKSQTLVEVKPFMEYDEPTMRRIDFAAKKACPNKEVLLLGPGLRFDGVVSLGLLGQRPVENYPFHFQPAILVTAKLMQAHDSDQSYAPGLIGDFYHETDYWGCRVSGFYEGNIVQSYNMGLERARDFWGRAAAAVQYKHKPEAIRDQAFRDYQ